MKTMTLTPQQEAALRAWYRARVAVDKARPGDFYGPAARQDEAACARVLLEALNLRTDGKDRRAA